VNRGLRKGLTSAAIGFVSFMTVCLSTIPVYAQMDPSQQDDELIIGSNTGQTSELLWSFVKVIFVLVLIIGMIYMVVRVLAKKNQSLFGRRNVRVLSGVQLAPGKSLQIIELAGQVYILGVGEDVRLLDRVTDAEQAAAIIEQLSEQEGRPIAPFVGEWLQRLRSSKADKQYQEARPSFEELFRERLNKAAADDERRIDERMIPNEQDEKERSKP